MVLRLFLDFFMALLRLSLSAGTSVAQPSRCISLWAPRPNIVQPVVHAPCYSSFISYLRFAFRLFLCEDSIFLPEWMISILSGTVCVESVRTLVYTVACDPVVICNVYMATSKSSLCPSAHECSSSSSSSESELYLSTNFPSSRQLSRAAGLFFFC